MSDPAEVAREVFSARSVLLATHVPPDGDGLGAGVALARVLAARGARAVFAAGGPVQHCLTFFLRAGEVDFSPRGPEGPFDLAVALDAATAGRLGGLLPRVRSAGRVVNLDHHAKNERFGDVNWVDPDSPAVGEMVFRLLRAEGVELTADLAMPLYVALSTDTGRFSYSNTTPAAHRMAAALIEAGVRPQVPVDRIWRSRPFPFLKLTGLALERLSTLAGGLVAHVTVTPEMVRETGADPLDVGDVVDLPISVEGVEVAVLFREGASPGSTKVSLRSREWFPVNAFAARWGGGGHPRAAGLTLDVPVARAPGELLPLLEDEVLRAARDREGDR